MMGAAIAVRPVKVAGGADGSFLLRYMLERFEH